jgi:large subunit ribosomal protein L9
MKIILTESIDSLGLIGAEVEVAKGYARNFLLPRRKAVLATDSNRAALANQKAKLELQIAKERAVAEEMAQRLAGVSVTVAAKVSDADRLYGSVGVREIVDALAAKDITVEKRMVLLTEPIKTIGTFEVPIRIYTDVEPVITVNVSAE